MFISEAELAERINSEDNLVNILSMSEISLTHRKRFNGGGNNQELTTNQKVLIGTAAQFDKHTDVAREFGVSVKTVDRLSKGISGEGYVKNEELASRLEESIKSNKETIVSKALDRLLGALDIVGARMSNGLQDTDTQGVAGIAKDMATIVHRISGGGGDTKNLQQVIIVTPQPKKLAAFEVIDVP